MEPFFIFLELMIPIASGVLILRKGSLAIVYMPVLFFAATLFEDTKYIPGPIFFYLFVGLLLYFIFFNLPYLKRNLFSNLIIIYFFFLVVQVNDFKSIQNDFLNVMWLFVCIPLIPEIYKRHSREVVFNELTISAFAMMSLFVVNVLFSTYFNYNPRAIYGIKSGILYGKMSSDIYNIFPFAIFMILRKGVRDNKILYLGLYFISMFFILLTMRRSVMALSLLGSLMIMIELVKFEEIKKFFLYGIIISVVAIVGISQTDFMDQFMDRFEQRGLETRSLQEENRLMEFQLIYKDLFVYFDYDPWFGYGLFDSAGNYGKKIFGQRTLHTDFAAIIHSSGIVGLFLYLMMLGQSYLLVWRNTKSRGDYIQFLFISLCFLVFFINGRYTTVSAMILMLLVFYLPTTKKVIQVRFKEMALKN